MTDRCLNIIKKIAADIYTTKKGDTPESIARKHGVKTDALMKFNKVPYKNATRIPIGFKWRIPPAAKPPLTIRMGQGDTVDQIVKDYGASDLQAVLRDSGLTFDTAKTAQIGQPVVLKNYTKTTGYGRVGEREKDGKIRLATDRAVDTQNQTGEKVSPYNR